jgi:DNA transformation protein
MNLDFADEAVERLEGLVPSLRARRMFGGVGLYSGESFFGIIAFDRLWFKVDESNRGDYQAYGMEAFKPFPDRPTVMSYFEVPMELLNDSEELRIWAMKSVTIARRTKKKSSPKHSHNKASVRSSGAVT